MRISIPIPFRAHGGGHYFLAALAAYVERRGWSVLDRLDARYDIIFTNHWQLPRNDILRAIRRNPGVRVVQRVDGAAADYGRQDDADPRQRAVNLLADLTIFQSRYSRYATREKFPVIPADGPIIYNPVDLDCFRPDGPRLSLPEAVRVACVTWSTNPLKGAASIYRAAEQNADVGFVLCGRYPDAPELPNVHRLGVLGREELATALRSCDALLTFSENEACPNHVIEALACGLPVLYHDSGAAAEVVGDCGEAVTVAGFRGALERVRQAGAELSRRARARAESQFHSDRTLARYVAAIEEALSRPTRVPVARRYALAWAEPLRGRARRLRRAQRSAAAAPALRPACR